MNGIVLFAHGARDPRWAAPFEAVALRVRAQRPDARVALAYLELMAPTLADAAATPSLVYLALSMAAFGWLVRYR